MKVSGETFKVDQIYKELVAKEGLFGKAFFGHKKSKAETRRLNFLWRVAQKGSIDGT